MSDDDDLGKTYDLDAWAAPAPGAGLADRVIAQLRRPPAVVAIEPDSGGPSRRWWIAGGIAGALAAAAVLVAVVGTMRRAPVSGSGAVIADKARSVELGDSHVQLDPGAELTWERDQHRVRVVLRQGAATFAVAGDDTFVIDGASLASVEATGASLRMEVRMTASDPRVIGASAVTAAAVAMLTIVVYEGHVKASHGGRTQTVEVGGTLEVRAPAPPAPPPVAVGAGPDYQAMLDAKDREIEALKKALDEREDLATGDAAKNRSAPKKPASPPPPAGCDADALLTDALIRRGDEMASTGMWAAALAAWEAAMKCKPSASLVKKAAMAACNSKNQAKAKLYVSRLDPASSTGVVQICVRNGVDVSGASCDATAETEKGQEALGMGMDTQALRHFETALGCGAGVDVERLATLAACRTKNEESARRHYARLSDQGKQQLVQPCLRNGIDLGDVKSTGTVQIASKPPARVFVDGKDLGLTTPMTMNIVPGRHKVTLQVGDEKYTYTVLVEAGKTVSMMKSLE